MTRIELTFWVVLFVLGIGLSALWSGLETAMYVVGRPRLEARVRKPDPDQLARVLKAELDRPEQMLASLLILNNASNYIGILAIARVLDGFGLVSWQISAVNTLLLTPVLFVFAETLPKELFRMSAERLAYVFAPVMRAARYVLTATLTLPLVVLMGKLAQRMVGAPGSAIPSEDREHMVWLVREAVGQGIVSEAQADLVRRAIAFRDARLHDEMIPWARVSRLRVDISPEAGRRRAAESGKGRYPVVDRRGAVLGVVRARDLFLDPDVPIRRLMKPVMMLDVDLSAREALQTMRSENATLAVVHAKGRPIGLVTIKDLVEPVTGELAVW